MKTLSALRHNANVLHEVVVKKVLDQVGVIVTEREPPGPCEICQGPMRVQKTFRREGRTIAHGTFKVHETVWACAAKCHHPSGQLATRRANSVVQCILPNSIVGYDVMVFVGLKRYLYHKQREDIRAQLRKKHSIDLSTGEISNLGKQFLDYLSRLHYSRADQLKEALERDGGWPMHVDATGENGRGTLLVAIAGWKKWVLGSWKISTERSDLILPCLQDTVRRFGPPCAAVRDLGRGITPAINDLVSEQEIHIPVLACHQHFLADIGTDLLKIPHSELRNLFRGTKVRPKLGGLVRDLSRQIGSKIDMAREAVQAWQSMQDTNYTLPKGIEGLAIVRAIAQWVLDYLDDSTGLDFPFDLPYLDFYNRCKIARRAMDAFLRTPPDDSLIIRIIKRFYRYIDPVSRDVAFRKVVRGIRRRDRLFKELRCKLRLASNLPENESEEDLNSMREEFDKWIVSLEKGRPERGPSHDIRSAIDTILKHVKTHGDNLWGHVISLSKAAGGGIRLVERTNQIAENFFKEIKHKERQRSGRRILTQDLENLPSSAPYAYNLKDTEYVTILCGSIENLPIAFAIMDQEEQDRRKNGVSREEPDNLEVVFRLASSSLSTEDKRIVRTDDMNRRVKKAANSRAPRVNFAD